MSAFVFGEDEHVISHCIITAFLRAQRAAPGPCSELPPAPLHDHLPPRLSRWRLQTKLQGPLLWTAQIMARDAGLTTSWASDVSPLVHSVPPGETGSPQCLGLRVDAVEA